MLYLNIKKNSFIYHDKQYAIETLIRRQSNKIWLIHFRVDFIIPNQLKLWNENVGDRLHPCQPAGT